MALRITTRTVERFDAVKVTFNYSGILIAQLLDYVHNGAQDTHGILSIKNPRHLTRQEHEFITRRFFAVNFERYIKPHKRYLQLFQKVERA